MTIGPGGETYVGWPGRIGGPVKISVLTGANVIASQRVQYDGSSNESGATPTTEASPRSVFTWYDHASPGMQADNIHLTDPDPGTDAQVTVSGPGPDLDVTVPHGGQTYT